MVTHEDSLIPLSKSKSKEEIASWDKEERMLDGSEEDSGSWIIKAMPCFLNPPTYTLPSLRGSVFTDQCFNCDKRADPYSTDTAILNLVIFPVTLHKNFFKAQSYNTPIVFTWGHCMTIHKTKNLSKNLGFGMSFSFINQSSAFRSSHSTPISYIFLCTVVCQ